ncbi:MAG: LpqB family beta-propeller domain-containing protein [Betaproteobacteria bacterium]
MKYSWSRFPAVLVLLAAAAGPIGRAQTRRPMTLVDLVGLSRVVDPELSPDGRRLVFQVNTTDWKADRRIPHLWLQEIGGAASQLTFGASGEWSARWSPDGRAILFLTHRGDAETQIYLLPAGGGEARELTHHVTSVSQPAWAPDGSAIYFLASDPKTPEELEREREKNDVYLFDADFHQRQLWKVIVSTGAEEKLTEGASSVLAFRVSRDGRRIAMHRAPTPLLDDGWRSEVWVVDADGGNPRVLTHNDVEEEEAELSPDDRQILFLAGANERFEPDYTSTVFLGPADASAPPRPLLPEFPYEIQHAAWSPDGKSILAVANMGVHTEIFRIDVASRQPQQLTDGRHNIPDAPAPITWSLVPSAGKMVFQLDEPTRIGDIWTLATDDRGPGPGTTLTRVSGFYDFLAREFELPRQEKIEWKGADGVTVEGLIFYPLDYHAGTRYPLVVELHGGPNDSDKFGFWTWVDYPQVLAARGYVVLRPNYRGSTGYGNAFLRDMVGHYFHNAPLDVMAGVDALIRQGLVDPDRMAVAGFSAGGHLTNRLITLTDRFTAAASAAGAADWLSFYSESDLRASRTAWFGGTPWQKNAPIDVYWSQSPIKDVANVKTPTVFLSGEQDERVPMPQQVQMYRGLKANGVPTMLWVAPREGHNWFTLRHQLAKGNIELGWIERYVMGRAYTPEKAPEGNPRQGS